MPADPAANSPLHPHISSRDYQLPDHHEYHIRCSLSGHNGTEYIENMTLERRARVDKSALRICIVCYNMAGKREQNERSPLPWIPAIGRMETISKDIGRCLICNPGEAMYPDREAGTSICQYCYDSEARMTGPVEGGNDR